MVPLLRLRMIEYPSIICNRKALHLTKAYILLRSCDTWVKHIHVYSYSEEHIELWWSITKVLVSIFKSLSKFHSLNYHLKSLLHKNCFLYVSTLQQLFYNLCTLYKAIFIIYLWLTRNAERRMATFGYLVSFATLEIWQGSSITLYFKRAETESSIV